MNVVIAAGGTAGHVNPALAVARAMPLESISFIGTERGLESRVVPEAGYQLDPIDIAGFDRAQPLRLPSVGIKAQVAVRSARALLTDRNADVVLGMGGYVSLPVVMAARSRSIPFVLHEQNIVLGLAHKVSKRFAATVAVSFEETLASAGERAVLTGNPVLPEIAEFDRSAKRASGHERFGLDPARRTILFFGGSLGARTINTAAPLLAHRWRERDDIQVLHISGRSTSNQTEGPGPDAPNYHRVEYTSEMAEVYAVADLGVCRSGASTVAELAAVGLPSVVIPYPHHRDRQQERHGEVLVRAGASVMLLDAEAVPERVGELVESLLDDSTLSRMAAAARSLAKPDAALSVAELVRAAR
jgi:UDP-N-acetylglucosamine--N-acetylmuramyl-(pentapeptide) pyrophosphoryl-undecaprenol N-acetylglucosamine transferase